MTSPRRIWFGSWHSFHIRRDDKCHPWFLRSLLPIWLDKRQDFYVSRRFSIEFPPMSKPTVIRINELYEIDVSHTYHRRRRLVTKCTLRVSTLFSDFQSAGQYTIPEDVLFDHRAFCHSRGLVTISIDYIRYYHGDLCVAVVPLFLLWSAQQVPHTYLVCVRTERDTSLRRLHTLVVRCFVPGVASTSI